MGFNVKVNTILCIGKTFEWRVETGGSTAVQYYYAGSQRVAMRAGGTLYYLFGDHLGSTSLTTDASGNLTAELRYLPFGETRYASGQTPTSFRYTGQREDSYISLYWYNSRWYDPVLGRWAQPDTIIPNPYSPQSWDRFGYVLNNPIRYTDPSGHYAEEGAGHVAPDINRLIITNGFNYEERITFEESAKDVAIAYARDYNQKYAQYARRYGDEYYEEVTPTEAFLLVHDGPVYVEKQNYNCPEGCWGRAISQNKIYIYKNATHKHLVNNPKLIIHELGHVFENALDQNGLAKIRWSLTADLLNRGGFFPRSQGYQYGGDDQHGEIFADMFLHWVYGEWNPAPFQISEDEVLYGQGVKKAEFMNKNMAGSIFLAFR